MYCSQLSGFFFWGGEKRKHLFFFSFPAANAKEGTFLSVEEKTLEREDRGLSFQFEPFLCVEIPGCQLHRKEKELDTVIVELTVRSFY